MRSELNGLHPISGLVFWRGGRGLSNLAAALVACLAALPVLLPTVATFAFSLV